MKWFASVMAMLALATVFTTAPVAAQNSDHRMRVKIAVTDFKRSIEFYGILGMKPDFKHTEAQLELNWPGESSGILIVNDPGGKLGVVPAATYLMITVPDVKIVADQLRSAGFAGIGEPTNLGPAVLLRVKDPDGNQIELLSTSLHQPRRP